MENGNKLTLKIGPVHLNVVTGDPPEYLQGIASELDGRIDRLTRENPTVSPTEALAMAALQTIDETRRANESTDNLRGLLKSYLDDINRYRTAAEESKRECEKLRRELQARS